MDEIEMKKRFGRLVKPSGVANWGVRAADSPVMAWCASIITTSGRRYHVHFGQRWRDWSNPCAKALSDKDKEWLNDFTKAVFFEQRLLACGPNA